jgi:hypothetical protein
MKVVLFVLTAVLIGVGLMLAPKFMSGIKFAGFPGVYICKEFGLPDNEHSTLRVDENFDMFGVKGTAEVKVGKLKPIENSKNRAKIELSMELVHAAAFKSDPFADYLAEGVGNSLVLSATKEQQLLFSQPCFRK